MCDPGGAVEQAFEDVGDAAESVVRGANDAIDSGIRGVGEDIEQAAPYIIAAVALYFGIPPELVTSSEIAAAGEVGAITAADVAVATPYLDAGVVTGTALEAGVAGTAGVGTAGSIADAVAGTSGMNASGSPFFDQATIDLSGPGTTSFVSGGYGAPMAGTGAATAAEQAAAQQELLNSVAGATAAGVTPVTASGGVFDNFLNYISGVTPSSAASGLNTVSNLLKTGSTASNLLKAGSSLTGAISGINSIMNPGMSPTQAQNIADPFASSRQQYINQLNAVMANPSLTMSQPGYQFQYQQGLQGLNRKLAKSGMSTDTPGQPGVPASGAAGIAQQVYGQQYALGSYNDYIKQLSGLAGTGQLPGVGGQAALTAQAAAQKQAQTGWEAAAKGVGALSTAADTLGKSMGGGAPPKVSPGENAPWYTPTYDGAPPPIDSTSSVFPQGYETDLSSMWDIW